MALSAAFVQPGFAKNKKTSPDQNQAVLAPAPKSAQQAAQTSDEQKTVRKVQIVSGLFEGVPGALTFTKARVTTSENETLDCDTLKAKSLGKDLYLFTAEGNVKIVITREAAEDAPDISPAPASPGKSGKPVNRSQDTVYTAYSDKAVYDMSKNRINLTGSQVKIVVDSPNTDGPMIQTGNDAVILLSNDPKNQNYPDITMHNTITTFTPIQPKDTPPGNSDASSKTPK